ncbi:Wadjet anti-phage system protein JetA family protein [Effusibacillus pohliae]|uniref:Wadjet anti-phage system protein JetA family protein n=1 Tax=Effusibacillus pohliae TaxID=232270 RepID=UPI00037FD631|nr:Wadjet anti-phage system protein JetA family protein [Effusibacillus pohliae]
MKLFDVFPERFFYLLTGPNKHLYAEALLLLFEQSRRERFGIRLDVMRDLLQELIETHRELGLEIQLDVEEESVGSDGGHGDLQISLEELSRAQANALIRRMERLKWIYLEVRDQFQQYIVLPHYTSRILSLFQELCEARTVEYQRFAFVTYEILTGQEAKRRPCFAVREARQYTLQFEQELITLYNDMKHHMEQMVQKTTIQEVLDHHFEKYKSQIVDKSYHRLKTSDHVSRYRFQILQTVQNWLLDKDLLEETIEDGLRSEFYQSREEAEADIRDALYRIEETYSGLDEIFYQIDLKHNQYLRSSYDRARYLSQQHHGLVQQLAYVLERLSGLCNNMSPDECPWPELFRLQQVEVLNEGSLFSPRRKKLPHQPAVHVVQPIPDELKKQLRQENLERMRHAITRKKVESYVFDRLGERQEMELEELAPTNLEEFLLLTYVYLFGQDGASAFELRRSSERRILHIGQYRFTNHRIVRKRRRQH